MTKLNSSAKLQSFSSIFFTNASSNMNKKTLKTSRPSRGIGFTDENPHGFYIIKKNDMIHVVEFHNLSEIETFTPTNSKVRVTVKPERFNKMFSLFKPEVLERLRTLNIETRQVKNFDEPVLVDRSLGKELCVLLWSAENSDEWQSTIAAENFLRFAPEERWFLYQMAVMKTSHAKDSDKGWRKALQVALQY